MLPTGLPSDMPSFRAQLGSDEQCRRHLFSLRWPDGFRCRRCGESRCWAHRKRVIYECAACGKQHSLLAGTIFEQTKTGLAKWYLAIFLVVSSKGGISGAELKRQLGFGSDQTAWSWLHKIRSAMGTAVAPPLAGGVEAGEAALIAPRRAGAGAGRLTVAGAVEKRIVVKAPKRPERELGGIAAEKREAMRPRLVLELGRVRLAAGAGRRRSLLAAVAARLGRGPAGKGKSIPPVDSSKTWGEPFRDLPALHLVFSHVKRWLMGTHHGGVREKHLQAYLDEFAFRFDRRLLPAPADRFRSLLDCALLAHPLTFRSLVAGKGGA